MRDILDIGLIGVNDSLSSSSSFLPYLLALLSSNAGVSFLSLWYVLLSFKNLISFSDLDLLPVFSRFVVFWLVFIRVAIFFRVVPNRLLAGRCSCPELLLLIICVWMPLSLRLMKSSLLSIFIVYWVLRTSSMMDTNLTFFSASYLSNCFLLSY